MRYPALFALAVLLTTAVPCCAQSTEQLKADYLAAKAEVDRHMAGDAWLDDAPDSPHLLTRQWTLAAQFVAAFLNEHPGPGEANVWVALRELAPAEDPQLLALAPETYLVVAPGNIGNVFVVAKVGGRYWPAWSTADPQAATGKEAVRLTSWRAESARASFRGPDWWVSGAVGPILPSLGKLPDDAQGRARFYIDGIHAQAAGLTMVAQMSVWAWDGRRAWPLLVRDYPFLADQRPGTRLEGDRLKIGEKRSFRTFYSCGSCEERQTEWTLRITPGGIEDLGEQSLTPELDAVDELFDRVIHGKPAGAIASAQAIRDARELVQVSRNGHSAKEWKKFPSLGMMGGWKVEKTADGEVLCLWLDDTDGRLYTLRRAGGRLRVVAIESTESECDGGGTK